jgi:hypothetical protein
LTIPQVVDYIVIVYRRGFNRIASSELRAQSQ